MLGEDAAGDELDGDRQLARGGGAERVAAAKLIALSRNEIAMCWPWTNAYSSRRSAGTSKVIAIASSVSRSTRETASGCTVASPRQCSLNWSNGSPQSRQVRCALHAVEPKRDDPRVRFEPQRGQGTESAERAGRGSDAELAGLARVRSLIQSLVQAGRRSSGRPRGRSRARRGWSESIADRVHRRAAGVGRRDRDDTVPSSSVRTSRRMPRSWIETTGSSGSGIAATRACGLTRSPPDRSGGDAGARRAGSPELGCAAAGRRRWAASPPGARASPPEDRLDALEPRRLGATASLAAPRRARRARGCTARGARAQPASARGSRRCRRRAGASTGAWSTW